MRGFPIDPGPADYSAPVCCCRPTAAACGAGDSGRAALQVVTAPRPPRMTFAAAGPAGVSAATGPEPEPDDIAAATISNTTLVVVATDATLTKAQCTKLAACAHTS